MPELPEVEFARGCLSRWLRGQKLERVEADENRVIRGTPRSAFAKLAGQRVTRVERRGKWLLWHFDSDLALLAHLGMTGKYELTRKGAPPARWSRVRFIRKDGATVHYRDPRQFGHLRVATLTDLLKRDPLASLGPDAHAPPLSKQVLIDAFAKTRRSVKDVLMDQTVVAGLGNIQVTDALFLAKIHPARKATSLSVTETARVTQSIKRSLARTIAMNRGDKITYVEETKRVQNPFLIYGKASSPCPRCRTIIKKMVIGGRTTAYCPRCQPKFP